MHAMFKDKEGKHLEASEGHCQDSRCLTIILSCPRDRSKEIISDNLLLWAKLLIQALLELMKGKAEVSPEAVAQKNLHTSQAHLGGT